MRIQDVTDDLAESLGLEKTAGALVTDVPDGPAKDGGILQGDVILSFEGTEVADTRGLVRMVGNADVGAAVRMVVFREGKTQTLKVTLGRREDAEKSDAGNGEPMEEAAPEKADLLGMSLSVLSEALREELAEHGVDVVTLAPGGTSLSETGPHSPWSPAARAD